MYKGKFLTALFLSVATGLFVYGLTELLVLRFQKGDVYPAYSSYRSDPLGTKAFYEGLGLLQGVETVRNVEPLPKVSGLSETSLFLFGFERSEFTALPQALAKALEDAALGGGRIVISFAPAKPQPAPRSERKEEQEVPEEEKNPPQQEQDLEQALFGKEHVNLDRRWSVKTELSADTEGEASLSAPEQDLPPSLAWHSSLVFEPLDSAWLTLYRRAGKPVIIERSHGKGSIVLSSDSFFLSNEAMRSKRYPRLLSWLCGTHRKIVFDETHLGVSKTPGIATLLRKYGLAPFFVSLMVLALLALWKQSARFVPAVEEDEQAAVEAGKDVSTGFTNLLRRNISPDRILAACLEEWKRSFTHGKQDRSSLLPRIQEIMARERARPRKLRNPVQAYRTISALGRGR